MKKLLLKNKGAQAAIEFLVTYGWAILGVMIVVGTLAYFGIFNTQKYVSDVCYFGDQMTCEDYVLYDNSWTHLTLRNNFGVPVDIDSALLKSDYGITTCDMTKTYPNTNIQPGNTFELRCNLNSIGLSANGKATYHLLITFNRNGATNYHNQTGDITTTVQKWTSGKQQTINNPQRCSPLMHICSGAQSTTEFCIENGYDTSSGTSGGGAPPCCAYSGGVWSSSFSSGYIGGITCMQIM